VGYVGGFTPDPAYEKVCGGWTGHTEAVLVVFDPARVSFETLLKALLGRSQPDPGHAAGQRRRHAVPLGDLLRRRVAEVHQQYLHKVPNGYCGLGVPCPIGLGVELAYNRWFAES
jgi:peptide-methionine (S)-S-oxide reductase